MDIVRNMPESCYELSLKDLVEQQGAEGEDEVSEGKHLLERENLSRGKKNGVKKTHVHRSESMDNRGVLLNMMTPVSFGTSIRKKKSNSDSNFLLKESPKSIDGSGKAAEKEWWNKRENRSGGSSGGSKNSSSSTGSRNSSRYVTSFEIIQSSSVSP